MNSDNVEPSSPQDDFRKSGIEVIGDIPWGSHLCILYESKEELLEILIPYYKAGLENNEFCLWVAAQLSVAEVMTALHKSVPNFQKYLDNKSIEVIPYTNWYLEGGEFNARAVMEGWLEKLELALSSGFEGMRVHGNESWLGKEVWKDFINYERILNGALPEKKMLVMCTYPLAKTDASDISDVAHVHEYGLAKRNGEWEILEVPTQKLSKTQALAENKRLEQLVTERTLMLAAANQELTNEIAQHKETLNILRRAERNYREIFEKASDAIVIIEINTGKIIDCNTKACSILGYTKNELTTGDPSHISSLNMGYTHEEASEKIKLVKAEGDKVFEWQVKYKDGSIHWIEVSLTTADIAGKKRVLAFFHLIDARKIAEQELANEKQRKQMEITDAVITAAEKERQEIGQELHDNVQQLLSSAKLYLGMATKKETKDKQSLLTQVDTLLKHTIIELRNLSHSMISPFIEEYGLADALERLADTLAQTTRMEVEKQLGRINEAQIPDKLKLSIYRIAQEQFTNIVKYARATKVVVKLLQHNETILLHISDNGVGFDPTVKQPGIGFLNIKTRASLFNGTVNILSAPGEGCQLKVLFD